MCLRVLSDGSLFCVKKYSDEVDLCRVHADRSMQHCARVAFPKKYPRFDAQLVGNERRLAFALKESANYHESVALFRVDASNNAELLSRVELAGARKPLFCGRNLLVGVTYNEEIQEAVSFSTTGGILQRYRQLIARDTQLNIFCWCFVNGTVYAWDLKSKELLVYISS